jgi:hypothetical protein
VIVKVRTSLVIRRAKKNGCTLMEYDELLSDSELCVSGIKLRVV